jgi:arylsulfatase A-like enzyme
MKEKPNVLILHCHDLGDHLGCYPGNSARTPNMNRLAEEGVLFEHYFAAAPTCSPSRASMLTGILPHRNGVIGLATKNHMFIKPGIPTLCQLFRQEGYATASFGVWHVSGNFHDYGIETGNQVYDCERAADDAIEYLKHLSSDRPFFLLVGSFEPHRNRIHYTERWSSMQDPDEIVVPAYLKDTPEVRNEMVRFYGDSSLMDASFGRILDHLDGSDLSEDTIVVFTSDHGIAMPLAKGTLYDPGLKIPLIVRWKDHIRAGRRCETLTSNVDLMPTLLEAIGAEDLIPADLDGQSLWPFISDDKIIGHEHIVCEQTWHDFYEPIRALRTPRYKLIRNFHPSIGLQVAADILYSDTSRVMRDVLRNHPRPEIELYDLWDDPAERKNLSGRPEVAGIEKKLRKTLEERLASTDDPILDGIVPAPVGYMEHFLADVTGPGGLPQPSEEENWLTLFWPIGATEHRCPQ